jgi:hypothetical protein
VFCKSLFVLLAIALSVPFSIYGFWLSLCYRQTFHMYVFIIYLQYSLVFYTKSIQQTENKYLYCRIWKNRTMENSQKLYFYTKSHVIYIHLPKKEKMHCCLCEIFKVTLNTKTPTLRMWNNYQSIPLRMSMLLQYRLVLARRISAALLLSLDDKH